VGKNSHQIVGAIVSGLDSNQNCSLHQAFRSLFTDWSNVWR